MIAVFACLIFASAAPPADSLVPPSSRPVQVWLEPASLLAPGERARVFVHTSEDGNLVVLLARAEGGVTVLFPRDPAGDPFVRAGTYEILGPGDGEAVIASGTSGSGVVLAALSSDPVWFGEFAAGRGWNEYALARSTSGTDPEGALTDIVQRMLGDGSFTYDLTTYAVAPPPAPPTLSFNTEPLDMSECPGCDYQAGQVFDVVDYGYGVLANPVNYNCRWLHACTLPGYWWRDFPHFAPRPPRSALAMYVGGQRAGLVGSAPVASRPVPQPTVPAYRVASQPRSRSVVVPRGASVPWQRSIVPSEARVSPTRPTSVAAAAPLVARARSSAEVVSVAAARQRVLERPPRPAALESPAGAMAVEPGAPSVRAATPTRGRVGAPLAASPAPAVWAGVRPRPVGAPANVHPMAGMTIPMTIPRVAPAPAMVAPTAQTFALPHVPPRLRTVR